MPTHYTYVLPKTWDELEKDETAGCGGSSINHGYERSGVESVIEWCKEASLCNVAGRIRRRSRLLVAPELHDGPAADGSGKARDYETRRHFHTKRGHGMSSQQVSAGEETTLFDTPEDTMSTELVEHAELTPLAMIRSVIDRPDVDPERLRQLMDLYDRWQKDEARKEYNVAMKACQEEMPAVVTDAKNKHTQSRYAKLEGVTKTIKPIYTGHGFSLSYGTTESPQPNHVRVVCDCMHDGGHTQQYQLDCPYDMSGPQGGANKTAIQGMGSAVSYGRRYLKLMIFDVTVSDEDDDGQRGSKVTEEQLVTLREWIESTNTDEARFLKWLAVDKLSDVMADQFSSALFELKRKANKK